MINKSTILIIILIFSFVFESESTVFDSLRTELKNANGKQKVDIALLLAQKYSGQDLDYALKYAQNALDESMHMEYIKGQSRSLIAIGIIYKRKGDFKSALNYNIKAVEFNKIHRNKTLLVASYYNLGTTYQKINNYPLAIEYIEKAIVLAQETNDLRACNDMKNSLGNLYFDKKDYKRAIKYYEAYYNYSEKNNLLADQEIAINNIASVFLEKGENEKALQYFKKNLILLESIDDQNGIAVSHFNIASTYSQLNDSVASRKYFNSSIELSLKIKDKLTLADSYFGLALLDQKLQQFDKSLKNYKLALKYYEAQQVKEKIAHTYQQISNLFAGRLEFKKALDFQKLYSKIQTQIDRDENKALIDAVQSKVRADHHSQQISNILIFVSVFSLVSITLLVFLVKFRRKSYINQLEIEKLYKELYAEKARYSSTIKSVYDLKHEIAPLVYDTRFIKSLDDHPICQETIENLPQAYNRIIENLEGKKSINISSEHKEEILNG